LLPPPPPPPEEVIVVIFEPEINESEPIFFAEPPAPTVTV
jgi:hypothetical protein